ncbi:MAG: FAD-dependent oxidoreductase [Elusimicrobia bacterium]|nr:FAD-dependent oxidoreductase [Elusimicrobiota bacterium]
MKTHEPLFLTDAQLKAELEKCEYCAEKPCKEACPADCSPADFIMAARRGARSDYKRAAALIMGSNPLGGVCGAVCPDRHCMKACVRRTFDHAVDIPMAQATIIQKAKELGVMPAFASTKAKGKKVAVVGAGPAGFGAAAVLGQMGYSVTVFEVQRGLGGMAALIPGSRLDKEVLKTDLEFLKGLGDITIRAGSPPQEPDGLLRKNFAAVVVATGLNVPLMLRIKGGDAAVDWQEYLRHADDFRVKGKSVAVIGGGAVAADCAEVAVGKGAERVELFALEKLSEMPLTAKELAGILDAGVQVSGRVRVTSIMLKGKRVRGVKTKKVELPKGKKFHPSLMKDVDGTKQARKGFDMVIMAIGAKATVKPDKVAGVFYAGDLENGPTTVVEAVAAGKNAAMAAHAYLSEEAFEPPRRKTKSTVILKGRNLLPVPLATEFFGREIISPFLLSAAPPSDGYEAMKKAYEAGWAGGVMKTCFDGVPIHIPSEYMFAVTRSTYGNCDNVSGHPMDRVCREVEHLRREYPDRLTMASTGGPVTGNADNDRAGWQSNTRKLEASGVMGIEYSLSCPQGGDGTKGDIVSQDAELTARIIDWVMQAGSPEVPKLFKLTAAVTSIYPIIKAIREVFERYPDKKAGVTLANTFPALSFRPGAKKTWEEGVVIGLSGEGVIPISNLTLANVSKLGVTVSGNGGPMDYKAAADFLALGAKTVQFCTVAMKHGYGVVDDLHSGLSHLLEERGMESVSELIGRSLPDPITGFMELTPVKKISAVRSELCQHCGNCARCPYLAITLDDDKVPETDASKCIGCSICSQKCFSGALYMRERTKKELELLQEA